MAPDRSVGSPGRGDEADRLPRNYEAGHFGGYREPADGRHESGQRPAGAPRAGSSGRFRAVARAVEEGAAVAVGGAACRASPCGCSSSANARSSPSGRPPISASWRSSMPPGTRIGRSSRPSCRRASSRARRPRRSSAAASARPSRWPRSRRSPCSAIPRRPSRPPRCSRRRGASWGCRFRRPCPSRSTSTSRVSSPTCVPTR